MEELFDMACLLLLRGTVFGTLTVRMKRGESDTTHAVGKEERSNEGTRRRATDRGQTVIDASCASRESTVAPHTAAMPMASRPTDDTITGWVKSCVKITCIATMAPIRSGLDFKNKKKHLK